MHRSMKLSSLSCWLPWIVAQASLQQNANMVWASQAYFALCMQALYVHLLAGMQAQDCHSRRSMPRKVKHLHCLLPVNCMRHTSKHVADMSLSHSPFAAYTFCSLQENLCVQVMMNATLPPSKRSRVEREMDWLILFMFALLLVMCLIGAVTFSVWTHRISPQQW